MGKTQLIWRTEADPGFIASKEGLAKAVSLAHPTVNASLALVCDASSFVIIALRQQQVEYSWVPLSYFFKRNQHGAELYNIVVHL